MWGSDYNGTFYASYSQTLLFKGEELKATWKNSLDLDSLKPETSVMGD
jgi:hypothetical protein